jgi:hypothetical protein
MYTKHFIDRASSVTEAVLVFRMPETRNGYQRYSSHLNPSFARSFLLTRQ